MRRSLADHQALREQLRLLAQFDGQGTHRFGVSARLTCGKTGW
jgi:hypothetical protein